MHPKPLRNFKLRYVLNRIKPAWFFATLFLSAGLPLFADVGQPCPELVVSPVCNADGKAGVLISTPTDTPKGLRLLVSPQKGDVTHVLAQGQSVTLDAIGLAGGQMTLAVLGLEGDGAAMESCCFSNQRLRVPVCEPTKASQPAPDPMPETADFAVTLTLPENCPRNGCVGELNVSGPGLDTVDITLTVDNPTGIEGLGCADTGSAGALCQVASGGTIDLGVKPSPKAPAGDLEICAALGIGMAPEIRTLALQLALANQGYDPGPVDGAFGPATLSALEQLIENQGLPPITDEIPPEVLSVLALGPFRDAKADNNRACAVTTLPRPTLSCDPASTRAAGGDCACRFKGMKRASDTECVCPKGQKLGRSGCIKPVKTDPVKGEDPKEVDTPLGCDPATTVLRNGVCKCRAEGMVKLTSTTCGAVEPPKICPNGLPEIPGIGCIEISKSCSRVNEAGECCDELPRDDPSCP